MNVSVKFTFVVPLLKRPVVCKFFAFYLFIIDTVYGKAKKSKRHLFTRSELFQQVEVECAVQLQALKTPF